MTYGLSYYWDDQTVASYIGTDDYHEAMKHLDRLASNPRVHHLKLMETRTVTECLS